MGQRTATIQSPHPDTRKSPTSDRAANNAHEWLVRRLRWEHRVAELSAEHERARTQQNDRINEQSERVTGDMCFRDEAVSPTRPARVLVGLVGR